MGVPYRIWTHKSAFIFKSASIRYRRKFTRAAPTLSEESIPNHVAREFLTSARFTACCAGVFTHRLTQVVGGRKAIRRLEVERDSGVLKWEVDAVFGMKWDKVKLSEARVRPPL